MRDQPRPLEHAEMFMDAGEGHAKRTRQVRERRVARGQPREERPARGVGERGKRDVKCGIVRLNHMVKSRAGPGCVKPPRTSTACAVRLTSPAWSTRSDTRPGSSESFWTCSRPIGSLRWWTCG